jgi:hypothetical protein
MEDKEGRPLIRGPYYTDGEAQRKLDETCMRGEVYPLDTKNMTEAVRRLKEMRVVKHGVERGLVRFKRK